MILTRADKKSLNSIIRGRGCIWTMWLKQHKASSMFVKEHPFWYFGLPLLLLEVWRKKIIPVSAWLLWEWNPRRVEAEGEEIAIKTLCCFNAIAMDIIITTWSGREEWQRKGGFYSLCNKGEWDEWLKA